MGRFLLACCAVVLVAGCSSSSRPSAPTVEPARTYSLSGFQPRRVLSPGPTRLSFTIRQPSGAPLTDYKRGAGPHTGIHLIVVKDDLSTIVHVHPPIGADGRVRQAVVLPTPGPYRVVVDAYPASTPTGQTNFQLFEKITVRGAYRPVPPAALMPSIQKSL